MGDTEKDGLEPLTAVNLEAMRQLLDSLPGNGYRSVTVSFATEALGGALVTMTISIGDPEDDDRG